MSQKARSALVTLAKTYQPADLMNLSDVVFRLWEEMRVHFRNQLLSFGALVTPTTPSAQLTGVGNTTWNVNVPAISAIVDGVFQNIVKADDFSIHAGSFLAGFIATYSCIARLVVKNVTGTLSVAVVKGTPALTAVVKPPSDADIQTALGAGVPWIEIGRAQLNRTGDVTVTEAFTDIRQVWGQNVGQALDL